MNNVEDCYGRRSGIWFVWLSDCFASGGRKSKEQRARPGHRAGKVTNSKADMLR